MAAKPWVLGLSSGVHNGAACVCHGDRIVVAIQEERLSRIKRARLPLDRGSRAVPYCLDAAGITVADLDLVVDCTIARSLADVDQSLAAALGDPGRLPPILRIPHHLGHAYSAFGTSGFDASLVLIIDGGGSPAWQLERAERDVAPPFEETDFEHISVYRAWRGGIEPIEKHLAPMPYLSAISGERMPPFASFGHMFSSVALQIFGDYLEAGKVMALAPLGTARHPVEHFFSLESRGFRFSDALLAGFNHADRWPARQDEYADLAASTQHALEVGLRILAMRLQRLGSDRLCYAGGVALNSVANHRVIGEVFGETHVIPAAEDSGTAIGAALYGLAHLSSRTPSRRLSTDALGRSYGADEVDAAIAAMPAVEPCAPGGDVIQECARRLCEGRTVGWFQGGAEFGPRALGHRSILCDPRMPDAKARLNERIKHRESFRPFAPAILADHASRWLALDAPSELMTFMLEICPFRDPLPGPPVPAVVHVDGTGRLQTVTETTNPRFHRLLREFFRRTGVPLLVNTSMNIMGEPIVETPRDALWMLLSTGLDDCVIENRIVTKAAWFESVLDLIPVSRSPADREPATAPEIMAVDGRSSFHTVFDRAQIAADRRTRERCAGEWFRRGLIDVTAPRDLLARTSS